MDVQLVFGGLKRCTVNTCFHPSSRLVTWSTILAYNFGQSLTSHLAPASGKNLRLSDKLVYEQIPLN